MNPYYLIKSVLAATTLFASLPTSATTITQEVFANANSANWWHSGVSTPLDTGIFLQAGDHLVITVPVNDTWDGGAGPFGGPTNLNANGDTTDHFGLEPNTGFHYYSLIGKIDSNPFFLVGTTFNQNVASSGRLYLAFNDSDAINNSGSVTASITTSNVPEPATLGLLAAGFAALTRGEWKRKRRNNWA